jgi:hypothetical protein
MVSFGLPTRLSGCLGRLSWMITLPPGCSLFSELQPGREAVRLPGPPDLQNAKILPQQSYPLTRAMAVMRKNKLPVFYHGFQKNVWNSDDDRLIDDPSSQHEALGRIWAFRLRSTVIKLMSPPSKDFRVRFEADLYDYSAVSLQRPSLSTLIMINPLRWLETD